jgi:hypothetical protein
MRRLKDKNMRTAYHLAEINLLNGVKRNPETFNEKIRFKMAYDRNPKLSMFADKYQVRKFVEKRVGSEFLIPLLHSGKRGQDIFKLQRHREFVIKANHGSGAIIIVSKSVETESQLNHVESMDWRILHVKPDKLSFTVVAEIIDKWMNQNYSYIYGDFVEWAYRDIKPRFLVEELIEDVNGGDPIDYKFSVFNGKCQMIEIHIDRFRNHRQRFYSLDWQPLEMSQPGKELSELIPKPQELEQMIELSETLARGTDFLRVDLYLTNKGIKFGELTNYPAGGTINFSPEFWNYEIGRDWIPRY